MRGENGGGGVWGRALLCRCPSLNRLTSAVPVFTQVDLSGQSARIRDTEENSNKVGN